MRKVEQLKIIWKAKRQEFQKMVSSLKRLQLRYLDMKLMDIERMVDMMRIEDTKVMDLEVLTMDDVVIEEVDVAKENRLAWIKKKRLELWCKNLITELVMRASTEVEENMCRELVEGVVVDRSWNILEFRRIIDELEQGDPNLATMVEQSLREAREHMEAEVAAQNKL